MPLKSPRGRELLQGEVLTLHASAALTGAVANATDTAVPIYGERLVYLFLLDVTAAAQDAGDTLDVYVDTLIGATWINVVHFTQVLGNGGALKYFANILPENIGTTPLVSTDLAVNTSRGVVGSEFRCRYTLVDADADASITWSLTGYAL